MLATNGQHSEPLIVRFETGDHWDIGRESVATVRVNGIVCIADRKAWATAKFAYKAKRGLGSADWRMQPLG